MSQTPFICQLHRSLRAMAILYIALAWMPPIAEAQLPQVDVQRLGVDLVRLNDGTRLYGFALEKSPSKLTLAVERDWLQATYPPIYEHETEKEQQVALSAQQSLKDRLSAWIDARKSEGEKSAELVRFLEYELGKLEARIADVSLVHESQAPIFLVISIPRNTIHTFQMASPTNRQIAGIAYEEALPNVVTTPASLLQKRLVESGVSLNDRKVDLSQELPAVAASSSKQWAARKALFEYQMREPLEYQGTGALLVRKGDAIKMENLVGDLLTGGSLNSLGELGAELGLPEFQQFKPTRQQASWISKAASEAERDGFIGVLITRLMQSPAASEVHVEANFFAMESPGNWFEVARFESTANTKSQAAEKIERLKDDPQVQNATQLLKTLLPGSTGQLDLALAHGAATQQALTEVQSQFHAFLSRHINDFQRPQIPLSEDTMPNSK